MCFFCNLLIFFCMASDVSPVCKTLWVVEVIKWDLRRSLQEPPAAGVQSHMHRRAMRTIKISSWLLG